ncbi:MAG: TonB-dependent receptor plug domain-containing protein, partial [Bacteroidaceae bacterium]|nr:TonB-dependent receptor plug domain-containing protein [Bacteroidaceae bacterium]
MTKTIFTFALLSLFTLGTQAQEAAITPQKKPSVTRPVVPTKEIHGTVFDAGTNMPAAGIRVTAYNDRRYAAMTDENGEYTIKVPLYATSLFFEAEGYSVVEQSIGGQTELRTLMYSDKFAEIYDRSTTAQVARTAKATYNNNDISIDNQIQSNFGGDIRTLVRSGVPGQGIAMFMNGLNSLNANAQPLIVIDGVPQDMQLTRPSLHDGFFNNVLANIMVEDIEKISVLKNGTAIYGAKAANGVVVIETKRNKSMATRIDLSIGGSYELLPKAVDMMNANQFRVYASELIGTTGTKSNTFKFLNTDPNYYYYPQYHNNTDWRKQVYDEAFTQNYSINVQGGDDVANYNLSVGYALADATLKNTDFSRFNMRFNTDISLSSKASVRFDASYSDVTRDMRDNGIKDNITDGIISSPSFLSLIKSPFLSPFAFDASGHVSNYIAEADNYLNDVLANNSYRTSLANPVAILRNGDGDNKNYFGNRSISLSVRPKWDINRYWSITEHFAFNLVNTDQNYYLPTNGVP